MQSVFFCQKCSLDFSSVTSYIKHRKHFCELGREDEENYEPPEDGIGKLTLQEASERVKRALESRIEEVDPEVFQKVELIQAFKKSRRELRKRVYEERGKVLEEITLLKRERARLEGHLREGSERVNNEAAYLAIMPSNTKHTSVRHCSSGGYNTAPFLAVAVYFFVFISFLTAGHP
eukprot:sb/3471842/